MEQLVNFIIRPTRADYCPKNDLLEEEFVLKERWYQRKDLEITNGRGNVLRCSHYVPLVIPEGKALPCVVYCHGNSGCRADASEAAIILLPSNITVFALDFSGSGLSGGEHVTLGWNEKDDLRAVVNYLRTDGNVSCIGLWGRSMGAVTSLMYGAEDPSIAGMVLDSPFSNLVDLMMELVDTYKYPLPKFTVKLAIQHMRRVIKKKANFDIMDLNTIQAAQCCFVPVLFGHATDDDFIHPHHSDRIYDSYIGDKNIIKFDGDHNSPRPQFYFDSITIFFHNVLNPPKNASDEHYIHTMHNIFDRDNWDTIQAEYRNHILIDPTPELATSSTEDAINQLRSRRPMSRTEVPPDISSPENKYGAEGNDSEFHRSPSSSLSNDQVFPTTSDDGYAGYSFDGVSDIPCSMEDEERMLMEAIMESLKDLEVRHPQDDIEPNAGCTTDLLQDARASTTESIGPPEAVAPTAERSTEIPGLLITDSASAKNLATTYDASTGTSGSAIGSSSAEETDTTAGTRATLVVQKNPAGGVLDGLAQRWGRSFFKNRQ